MESNVEIIQELLSEFKDQRIEIKKMIVDLETIKSRIDILIPDRLDARIARFFEEKVKSVTELFKTILEMRKEIQKSLKDEIDLRRKIDIEDSDTDFESMIDVRGLADKVKEFQDAKDKIRDKIIEKAQKETDQIASEIVTIQESG